MLSWSPLLAWYEIKTLIITHGTSYIVDHMFNSSRPHACFIFALNALTLHTSFYVIITLAYTMSGMHCPKKCNQIHRNVHFHMMIMIFLYMMNNWTVSSLCIRCCSYASLDFFASQLIDFLSSDHFISNYLHRPRLTMSGL